MWSVAIQRESLLTSDKLSQFSITFSRVLSASSIRVTFQILFHFFDFWFTFLCFGSFFGQPAEFRLFPEFNVLYVFWSKNGYFQRIPNNSLNTPGISKIFNLAWNNCHIQPSSNNSLILLGISTFPCFAQKTRRSSAKCKKCQSTCNFVFIARVWVWSLNSGKNEFRSTNVKLKPKNATSNCHQANVRKFTAIFPDLGFEKRNEAKWNTSKIISLNMRLILIFKHVQAKLWLYLEI